MAMMAAQVPLGVLEVCTSASNSAGLPDACLRAFSFISLPMFLDDYLVIFELG